MNKDKEYKVHETVGRAEYFAASVAATFPEEFAETVARWFTPETDAIIEALQEVKENLKKEGKQNNG